MSKKILLVLAGLLFTGVAFGQYYRIDLDTQNPEEHPTIKNVFSGNTPYLRVFLWENEDPISLTGWTIKFKYSYGQYDTNGMVTIDADTVSSNRVDFIGGTNTFFEAYDDYYWSVVGTYAGGYTKTFGTGRMIQQYDPGASGGSQTLSGKATVNWDDYAYTGTPPWIGDTQYIANAYSNALNSHIFESSNAPSLLETSTWASADSTTNYALRTSWNTSNSGFQAQIDTKLGTSTWAAADSTTNYALRTSWTDTNSGLQASVDTKLGTSTWASADSTTNYALRTTYATATGAIWSSVNANTTGKVARTEYETATGAIWTAISDVEGSTGDVWASIATINTGKASQATFVSATNSYQEQIDTLSTGKCALSTFATATNSYQEQIDTLSTGKVTVTEYSAGTNLLATDIGVNSTGKLALTTWVTETNNLWTEIAVNSTGKVLKTEYTTVTGDLWEAINAGTNTALLINGSRVAEYLDVYVATNVADVNYVTNGGFSSSNWWSFVSNSYQDAASEEGVFAVTNHGIIRYTNSVMMMYKTYRVTFEATASDTNHSLYLAWGNESNALTAVSGANIYTQFVTAVNSTWEIGCCTSNNVVRIDDVAMYEATNGHVYAPEMSAGDGYFYRLHTDTVFTNYKGFAGDGSGLTNLDIAEIDAVTNAQAGSSVVTITQTGQIVNVYVNTNLTDFNNNDGLADTNSVVVRDNAIGAGATAEVYGAATDLSNLVYSVGGGCSNYSETYGNLIGAGATAEVFWAATDLSNKVWGVGVVASNAGTAQLIWTNAQDAGSQVITNVGMIIFTNSLAGGPKYYLHDNTSGQFAISTNGNVSGSPWYISKEGSCRVGEQDQSQTLECIMNLKVEGTNAIINDLNVTNDLIVKNNAGIGGTLSVTGAADFASSVSAAGTINSDESIIITNDTAGLKVYNAASDGNADIMLYNQGTEYWRFGMAHGQNSEFRMYTPYSGAGYCFQIALTSGNFQIDHDLNVSGALSKGSGTFDIDHPLAPTEKRLRHGFIEGPRYDLIYRGWLTLTNGLGAASIDEASGMTAGTFEALTRNPQGWVDGVTSSWVPVRVTAVVDGLVHVEAKESTCNDTISWLVIAERDDAWMYVTRECDENGRLIVEEDKPAAPEGLLNDVTREGDTDRIEIEQVDASDYRGYYRHPKAFGATQPTRRIIYQKQVEAAKEP